MKYLNQVIIFGLISAYGIYSGPCQSKPISASTNYSSTQQSIVSCSSQSSTKTQSIKFQNLPTEIQRKIFEFAGPDDEGCYPLQTASFYCKVEDVRFLLKNGADPDQAQQKTISNWYHVKINTPLYIAARKCDYSSLDIEMRKSLIILNTLLRYGADKNKVCGYHNNTPLHAAVESHNIPAIKSLIAAQAKLDVKNKFDRTPLDCARMSANNKDSRALHRKKMYEVAQILEQAGAQSSVPFSPMPTDEIMLAQEASAARRMELRHNGFSMDTFEIEDL